MAELRREALASVLFFYNQEVMIFGLFRRDLERPTKLPYAGALALAFGKRRCEPALAAAVIRGLTPRRS